MTPVVGIVGFSDSGKTTVGEGLTKTLTARGYRVAFIKHTPHGLQMDRQGSDTSRLFEAGAHTVVASGPGEWALRQRSQGDTTLEQLVDSIDAEVDLVIVEGFTTSQVPKILVIGENDPEKPRVPLEETIAVVGSKSIPGVDMVYTVKETDRLADTVEAQFLQGNAGGGELSLKVDGNSVFLGPFVAGILGGVLKGILANLKGVPEDARHIRLELRKPRR